MSEPIELPFSFRPVLATPALWAKLYKLVEYRAEPETEVPAPRPAEAYINSWAPHYTWPWDQAIGLPIFEERLTIALQAAFAARQEIHA